MAKKNKKFKGFKIQIDIIVCDDISDNIENELEIYLEEKIGKGRYESLYILQVAIYEDTYALVLKEGPDVEDELYGNKSLYENKFFQNLDYNIHSVLSIVDENLREISSFLPVIKTVDGKVSDKDYGYDKERKTKTLDKIYKKVSNYMTEYQFDNYDYEKLPSLYLNFLGNKVSLTFGEVSSSFVYFKEELFSDMACRDLLEKLDSFFEKKTKKR